MGTGGELSGVLSGGEIQDVRAQLRLADPLERARAVQTLRSWRGRHLDEEAAPAALRAATVGYPWVPGVPDDVGELLVELLWGQPHAVSASEIESCYVLCADRARRALLHLLALQADTEAVDVVGHLIGLDGPADLLPVPSEDLLTPLLEAPGVERLAEALVLASWRRGWAQHSATLLLEMVDREMLVGPQAVAVATGLVPLLDGLLDVCNRATNLPSGHGDLTRVERRLVDSLLPLFGVLPEKPCIPVLLRALASADPRIAARAAIVLVGRGRPVGEERIALLARDPEARAVLLEGFAGLGRHFAMPLGLSDERAVAEAELVRWLASETQLGTAPDEVEYRAAVAAPEEWGSGRLHVFAFRVRPPHWSAERDWMIGAVGPFDPEALFHPRAAGGFAACSLYCSENDDSLQSHVAALADAVTFDRRGEIA